MNQQRPQEATGADLTAWERACDRCGASTGRACLFDDRWYCHDFGLRETCYTRTARLPLTSDGLLRWGAICPTCDPDDPCDCPSEPKPPSKVTFRYSSHFVAQYRNLSGNHRFPLAAVPHTTDGSNQ